MKAWKRPKPEEAETGPQEELHEAAEASAAAAASGAESVTPLMVAPKLEAARPLWKVLIVDDEAFMRQAVAAMLHQIRPFQIYGARNGEEALRLCETVWPQVMILDLKMPGMSVVELCRRVREQPQLASLRICVLTGILADPELMRALQPYINDVLTKPPDPRRLAKMLEKYEREAQDDYVVGC